MSKARTLADMVATGGELADGNISASEISDITASAAELNILDGVVATTSEINTLNGLTADTAELNKLDGVTATTAELNTLAGITSTTAELNTLDGFTGDVTDLNRLDVTTEGTSEASKVVTASANGNVIIQGYLTTTAPIRTSAAFLGDVDALTSSSNSITLSVTFANTFYHILTENTTLTITDEQSGYSNSVALYIVQDSSASNYTFTWPSTIRWPGGIAPTLTTTASATDLIVLHYHSGIWHGYIVGQDIKVAP